MNPRRIGHGNGLVGGGSFLGIVLLTASGLIAPQHAMAQSSVSSLNDNQQSADAAVRSVCPRLGALVRAGSATQSEQDLFVRCNRVINASGGVESQSPALQALTAEEANAARTNTIEFGTASRSNVAGRLVALRNAGAGATVASLDRPGQFAFSTTGGASGDGGSLSEGRLGFFLQGSYGTGEKDPTRFEAGYDIDTLSVTGGLDYRFSDSFVAGIAIGYAEAESDFTRDSTGTAIDGSFDSDGISGSVYGSWYGGAPGELIYLDLIASYGDVDYESTRRIAYSVNAPGGQLGPPGSIVILPGTDTVNRLARGSTSGDTLGVGLGGGVDFGKGPWQFGPFFAVNYLDLSVDGFSETGADELSLLYEEQNAESLQVHLGLNLGYAVSTSRGVIAPYANAVWISEMKNDQDPFRLRYLSDPCARADSGVATCSFFDVASDEPDRDFLRWSVGLSAVVAASFSAFLDYTSVASLKSISYGEASVGLRYQFR